MSNYKAVWDSRTWAVTIAVSAILAVIAFRLLKSSLLATPRNFGTLAGFGGLVIFMLFVVMTFAPRAYRTEGQTLYIRTMLTAFAYDLSRVLEARDATRDEVFPGGGRCARSAREVSLDISGTFGTGILASSWRLSPTGASWLCYGFVIESW